MELMDKLYLSLTCGNCRERYEVPVADIEMSQELLKHEGCPGDLPDEYPPLNWRDLLPEDDLQSLKKSWERIEADAAKANGFLVLHGAK